MGSCYHEKLWLKLNDEIKMYSLCNLLVCFEKIDEANLHRRCIEGDSRCVINMLLGQRTIDQEIFVVVQDAFRLQRCFDSCLFGFVKRAYNNVAHVVSSHGCSGEGVVSWSDSPPVWLLSALMADSSLNCCLFFY